MKAATDSRGRFAAPGLIRPGAAFDASIQPDGSIILVELVKLVEKKVSVVEVKRNKDGTYDCPLLMTCEEIRADRDRQ